MHGHRPSHNICGARSTLSLRPSGWLLLAPPACWTMQQEGESMHVRRRQFCSSRWWKTRQLSCHLSLLKACRAPGQGEGPRRLRKFWPSDRGRKFCKKTSSFVKMNTESINLMENPSDFVEPYFTKKPWTLLKWFWSPSILWKTPWTFQ